MAWLGNKFHSYQAKFISGQTKFNYNYVKYVRNGQEVVRYSPNALNGGKRMRPLTLTRFSRIAGFGILLGAAVYLNNNNNTQNQY